VDIPATHVPRDGETDDREADVGGAHNRVSARDSLFLAAMVRREDAAAEGPVRVRNLSAGGMMMDCSLDLARGDRIEITLRGIGIVKGRVAWREDARIGVAFDEQIDPKLARKPVGSGGGDLPHYVRPTTSGRRPGLRSE